MGRYILRRVLVFLPMLWAITVVNFLVVNLAPGDPLSRMINPEIGIGRDQLEMWKKRFGLDQPLPIRYVLWVKEVAQGNLGWRMNHQDRRPVSEVLAERLPMSLKLMVASIFLANLVGILLGVISALRQYSWVDYLLTVFAFLGVSTPSFFLALGMIYLLSVQLGWFPTSGARDPLQAASFGDELRHLILPASALAIEYVAGMMRQARTSMLEVLGQDYVTTARAKGLPERLVIGRHAFRNALLPLITLFGLYLPGLIGGSIIVETIFAWPGMGALAIDAVAGRDYNMLMAIILLGSTAVLVANLLTDIAYAYVDPRIRYA